MCCVRELRAVPVSTVPWTPVTVALKLTTNLNVLAVRSSLAEPVERYAQSKRNAPRQRAQGSATIVMGKSSLASIWLRERTVLSDDSCEL